MRRRRRNPERMYYVRDYWAGRKSMEEFSTLKSALRFAMQSGGFTSADEVVKHIYVLRDDSYVPLSAASGASKRIAEYANKNPLRRRNAPWGSTSAEADRTRTGNPRGTGKSGVYLGKLDDMVVEVRGVAKHMKPGSLHVAWVPSKRDLALVVKSSAKPGTVDAATRVTHQKFHASPMTKAVAYDWPTPVGRLTQIGLIRSLTYVVPQNVKSPTKHGYKWVHAFGDHGESGHGPMRNGEKVYPDSLKPALCKDTRGKLFVCRRPGNKYKVTDWIYW